MPINGRKLTSFAFRGLGNETQAAGTAAQVKNLAQDSPHSDNWNGIWISLMGEQVSIFTEELNACRGKYIFQTVPDTFGGIGSSGKKSRNNFGLVLK